MPDAATPAPGAALLIAALSGRALAAAARRSGYVPLVADLFGDDDTRALSGRHRRARGDLAHGLAAASLPATLAELARGAAPLGLVYGSGFEHRPELLRRLGEAHGLLGNDAATVARTKHPRGLAELCSGLGVPHPEISVAPQPRADWLRKRAGASGGEHVAPAEDAEAASPRDYWQRRVPGAAVSALLLGDGARCLLLGFSAQWSTGEAGAPFRYAGAVRPAPPSRHHGAMGRAAVAVAEAAGLRGLNSADFLLTNDGFHMIEINPRPGASLDVFAHPALLRLHVEACAGRLPDAPPAFPGASAAAVVYTPRATVVPHGFVWPDWAADREPAGRPVAAGHPLCTVLVQGEAGDEACALVAERTAGILARIAAS